LKPNEVHPVADVGNSQALVQLEDFPAGFIAVVEGLVLQQSDSFRSVTLLPKGRLLKQDQQIPQTHDRNLTRHESRQSVHLELLCRLSTLQSGPVRPSSELSPREPPIDYGRGGWATHGLEPLAEKSAGSLVPTTPGAH